MKSALVVIDVQHGLFDASGPYGEPFEGQTVVARIHALASGARAAGVPVIWVQHERPKGFLAHATPEWALPGALGAQPGDTYIRKTTPDSFLRTDLQAVLEAKAVSHLTICGYASEFCIDTTTRSAAAKGYAVTLVADAHTTHDKPHASAALIRAHGNATLPNLTSFGVAIQAVGSSDITWP
jgi:nicotinamidase-related amidase